MKLEFLEIGSFMQKEGTSVILFDISIIHVPTTVAYALT